MTTPTDAPDADAEALTQRLETQVSSIVGNLSSWWSGVNQQVRFRADQSHEALEAARTHIETQGGVLAAAKQGIALVEAKMEQVSQEARAKARQDAAPTDDGPALDTLGDAGDEPTRDQRKDDTAQTLAAVGANAWASLQQLAHLPQVVQLQEQLTQALQTDEDGKLAIQRPLERVLHDAESLVSKYVHEGEAMARDVGTDLRGLLDDVVKIVPPEDAERAEAPHTDAGRADAGSSGVQRADTAATIAAEAATHGVDADDFSWEEESDAAASPEEPFAVELVDGPATSAAPPTADSDSDWE